MDLSAQKARLREAIKERMARLRPQDRQAESRSLCRRVLEHLPADVKTVAAYYPMPSEADIVPLLEELLRRGIAVYLPRAEGRAFLYRRMESLAALKPGTLRIPEPAGDAEVLEEPALDVALIPGAAFDRDCNRLGRGNGGYDIWLEKLRRENPSAKVWGIALDPQLTNEVPMQPHDQRMDAVITPRGIILRGQKPSW